MAGLRLDVRSNIDSVLADLTGRMPQVIKRATSSGLNVGMRKAQQLTVRAASKKIGVAQKHIRGRMKRSKATRARLVAQTRFNPRGLNPLRLGLSPSQALKFYSGPRVSAPFVMRMPNGSQQIVVRLPQSRNPSPSHTGIRSSEPGTHRKGRLPVASIRIFIGRTTVDRFVKEIDTSGALAFEKEFRRILLANWGGNTILGARARTTIP